MSVPELVPDPPPSEPSPASIPRGEPGPFAEIPTPQPGEDPREREPQRALVIALVILLTIVLLALFAQLRTRAALESQVSALELEVAQTRAAVASYQSRFERVRDEVGELVTRIGALSSLVAPPVLPRGDSVEWIEDPGGEPQITAPAAE